MVLVEFPVWKKTQKRLTPYPTQSLGQIPDVKTIKQQQQYPGGEKKASKQCKLESREGLSVGNQLIISGHSVGIERNG